MSLNNLLANAKIINSQLTKINQLKFMTQSYWNSFYKKNREQLYLKPDDSFVEEIQPLLDSKKQPMTVLDLAAGAGCEAIWLAERGCTLTSVDFSSFAIQRLKKIAAKKQLKITAIADDVLNFKPEQQFDLVIICYLHLDVTKRRELLKRIPQFLKPNGYFLNISIEQKSSIEENDLVFAPLKQLLNEIPQELTVITSKTKKCRIYISATESFEDTQVLIKAIKQ